MRACRKVLITSTAVVICACGAFVSTHFSQFDDDPAPRSRSYSIEMPEGSALGSGGGGMVSQVSRQVFAGPRNFDPLLTDRSGSTSDECGATRCLATASLSTLAAEHLGALLGIESRTMVLETSRITRAFIILC
jgi:hypothetical protein